MRERSWLWFGAWALEGGIFALGVLAAASFGLFLVPVALVLLLWLARTVGSGPEMLGAISGFGLPTLAVAALEAGPGSLDARPWFAAGLLLVATGVAAYALVRRRTQPPSTV